MVASSTFNYGIIIMVNIVAQNDSPRGTHLRCTGPYLMVIDNSLGFDTAVHEEAQQAINAAHVVAESIENGIGVVKLMGQYYESPFYLEGPGGHFEFIEKRLKEHGHMVIVIAEGAGKDLLTEGKSYHGPATPRRWFVDITKDKVKSYFDGDDCGCGAGNKENNASVHPGFHHVSLQCPSDFKLSRGDFDVIVDWSCTYKYSNAYLGGCHGKMIKVEVNSKILEVPSGILPSSVRESNKEAIYRLHMEDQEVYTPKRLAKDYNTAAETVDEILLLRDALTNRKPEHIERAATYRMYKENPEIYTIERLAKDFKIARGTTHLTLFAEHVRETILQPK
ncbi:hypothetical protein LWI29_013397 [Acer saccharum]|uniref:Uncharacterized protein n=1 Tax=Acer saccharum TaxID=4024 RepID=A0AA39SQC6_ACESA|nr:hypothetical protein LWI29_013397 [Acer saccharum]